MQFLDLQRQYVSYREEIDTRMRRVLEHTHFVMGPEIEELEQALAARVSVAHAITTCLLYTSPSPRDLSTSRMPSSA